MSYVTKAKDSFKTKINLFIYYSVSHGKNDFTFEDFKSFSIDRQLVEEYTTIYWQEAVDFKIRNKTIREIEFQITKFEKENIEFIKQCESWYIKEVFPKIFPVGDFEAMIKADKCFYCGITTKEITQLANLRKLRKKNLRGWSLEIDRLDSNYEYTPQNCEMCCYWCNNAKTDEFTPTEFKFIGQMIGNIWNTRLRASRFVDDGAGITVIKK
jgi:hypothetical protein